MNMFSGKDAANPSYPTQWALNPSAYQNVDCSQVDWATLAQQWIAMKEAAAIVAVPAPPPPSTKPDMEQGEAPMEVENPDNNDSNVPPPDWNASGNNWSSSWNQWNWGWSSSGPVDSKIASDPLISMADGYPVSTDNNTSMPGYTSGGVPPPTFQHGYWTAPQVDQMNRNSSAGRDRRSKSKNIDKPTRALRPIRDKVPGIPPVIEPIIMPTPLPTPTIDAAKRRQLPAWIREGLEKMEREKQRALEREQEKKEREEAEKEQKRLEEEELKRIKAEAGGQPILPPKSKFESDSESEESIKEEAQSPQNLVKIEQENLIEKEEDKKEIPLLNKKSKEEIMQEVMLAVRRSLTEILLEVTDQEIHSVSQEELARYNAAQASRLNAMKASKSKALAALSGLGLGAYESSSEESADEDQNDLSDQQLQEIIKRKRIEFEKTSREIDAEVKRAEQKEANEEQELPTVITPERPRRSRSSATPPPVSDTPDKIQDRRVSKDKKNIYKTVDRVDGARKLEPIPEEKSRKGNKGQYTPSPQKTIDKNHKETSSTSSSNSDKSSSSSSSSTESEAEKIESKQSKKRRRRSSSVESNRKVKKQKEKRRRKDDKDILKSRHEDYDRSEKTKSKRKDDYYEKFKSRSRDYERSHKDKYRDSDEDRPKKRSKRSRSASYESRSGRRRSSRDRSEDRGRRREKKSYDRESSKRDRSYDRSGRDDKYDRYERSRDYDRRRSRSGSYSRHRR